MIQILKAALGEMLDDRALHRALQGEGDAADPRLAPLVGVIRSFVASMPDALSVAYRIEQHPQCQRATAFGTGQILHYLFLEDDLLPEKELGIAGLLDDAYLIHRYVAALAQQYPFIDLTGSDYAPPASATLRTVGALLPEGIADALDRTARELVHVAGALFSPASVQAPPDEPVHASLRIAEAMAVVQGGGSR